MLDAKEQLQRLLRIQDLALEMQAAHALIEGAPARIEEIEAKFRERNAEYVSLKSRYEEVEKDRRDREIELAALEESRKKYMDSLMQVKNQREYAAVLKELDAVKAQIGTHEDAIVKDMEEGDTLRKELEARAAHIDQERAIVEAERARVEKEVNEGRETVARAEAERARIEEELPRELVEDVRRVEESRKGLFLVRAEKELCQACFVRVRPQVFQEIKAASRIHTCGNCRRYLYWEPVLRPSGGEPSLSDADASETEAADGGQV